MLTNVKNKLRYFLTYHIKSEAFKSIAEQGCQPSLCPQNRCPLTLLILGASRGVLMAKVTVDTYLYLCNKQQNTEKTHKRL